MKKLFMTMVAVAAFCGCDETPKEGDGSLKPDENTFYTGNGPVSKVKIEGHDYLLYRYYKGGGICHSASCPCHTNNPNHIVNFSYRLRSKPEENGGGTQAVVGVGTATENH